MIPAVQTESQAATKESLLKAAAEVFAQVGFRAATVRQICERAGANIAAVNYHFGDKEKLYLEVLRHTQAQAFKKFPPDLGLKPNAPAEEKLKAFVRSFLLRIFDEGEAAHHGKIMSHEMIDPTHALDALVQERIRPLAAQLNAIVRELLGKKASEELVRRCASSVVSQCCFYHHCRPVISRLFPEQKFSAEEIEKIAGHITEFSVAALKQVAMKKKK
jgi:TetR/AcrR family transcriptional regulator, regulator of cefoperazone and chloramphenicol sensitivity